MSRGAATATAGGLGGRAELQGQLDQVGLGGLAGTATWATWADPGAAGSPKHWPKSRH
jgi:hypothetical protein